MKANVYWGAWCERIWRARSEGPGPRERIEAMVGGCEVRGWWLVVVLGRIDYSAEDSGPHLCY